MVGYPLRNTMTPNGSVARGVCEADEGGLLKAITERTKIFADGENAKYTENGTDFFPLSGSKPVSLNFWIFNHSIFDAMRRGFEDARRRILCIATVLGNVGFLGLPLVSAMFPDQPIVACYSTVYALSMNLVVFTVGVFLITRDRRYMSLRAAIFNPTSLTILFTLPSG